VSVDWELQNPDSLLQALSSSASDHAPLHLSLNASFRPKRRFRFELFWLKLDSFDEAIREAWTCDPSITDPFRKLDALFRNSAACLQSWGQRKMGNIKLQIAIANTVIFRFDAAQDRRALSPKESWLRKTLKQGVLGLASLERTIARLQEGDANTKLFHAVANGRRAKNFIPSIRVGNEIVTDQDRKVEVFTDAYSHLMGTIRNREHGINLEALNIQAANLEDLEAIFTEEEVWQVIKDMPADRAPGPDAFIGAFYQRAWPVIKTDIMRGLLKLGVGDGRGFARLNRAIITLVPKKWRRQKWEISGQLA
jgi:mannosylglycoprotein endo-beta-mannosidase